MDAIGLTTRQNIIDNSTTVLWFDKYNQKNFILILLISSAPFLLVTLMILVLFAILARAFTIYKIHKRKQHQKEFSIESVLSRSSKIETNYARPSINKVNDEEKMPKTSSDNQAYLENESKTKTSRKKHDINEKMNNKLLNKFGNIVTRDPPLNEPIESKIIKIDPNNDDNRRISKVPTIVIHPASDDDGNQ